MAAVLSAPQERGVIMNIHKFTQKSVEAINDCEKLAYEYGNQLNPENDWKDGNQ